MSYEKSALWTQKPHEGGKRGVGVMLGISLGLHTALLAAVMLLAHYAPRLQPPPQQVIKTQLVRLGEPRKKELLPRLVEPPRPAQPKAEAPPLKDPMTAAAPVAQKSAAIPMPIAAPAKPLPPSAQARIRSLGKVNRALDRLRARLDGQHDGAAEGDADVAVLGHAYTTLIQRCWQQNYVIEGYDAKRVAGLEAVVLVRINADGSLASHQIIKSPGVVAFDQAVNRAITRCSKMSPPPAELARALHRDGIEINFKP